MSIRWYRSYYHLNSLSSVSHLSECLTFWIKLDILTSFGLISLLSPFFLFLFFHISCFLFVHLWLHGLIGVSSELILMLTFVFWRNVTALFSLWHWRDIARPLQCCGNVFLSRWNDIIVTLPCCWGDWSYGTLSVISDGWFWWFAVNGERQSASMSYLLMETGLGTGRTDIQEHYVREGLSLSDAYCTL